MENSAISTEQRCNKDRFTLHIVSPTAPKFTFTNLPCSTTVAQLRNRIFEAYPFHPPVDSQRLIYRGHPILQPERTLLDVFTQQAINASDGLTLHLVTPPIPSYPQHQHSTLPHPLASNTQATAQPLQQSLHPASPAANMAMRQSQVGQSVAPATFITQTTPPQAHQLPALQQSFQQFQAIQAQITAQLAALHNQILTNNHLANQRSHVPQHQPHLAPGPDTVSASAHPQSASNPRTLHRGSTTTQRPPEPVLHGSSIPSNNNASPVQVNPAPNLALVERRNPSSESLPAANPGLPSLKAHQQDQGPVPLRDQGVERESYSHTPHSRASASAGNDSTADPSQGVDPGNGINFSEQQRPAASAVYILSSSTGPQALLVSPSGLYTTPWPAGYPHAITSHHVRVPLPTISGIISHGPPLLPHVPAFYVQPQAAPFAHPPPTHSQQVQGARFATPPAPPSNGFPQVQQQHQQPQQAQQPQQQQRPQEHQQQARDIVRILIPLGGHLWLFVRLFGFVWFFTHGASWSRTILLCVIATVVFIGQSGMFRSVFQGLWDPIRRHADNLMPVAGHEQPRPDGRQATSIGAEGTAGGEPSPEQAAQRLLEQRRAQGEHVIQHLFRRAERAIALFLASLAPGVAERHIQARDAAEAARQLHQREREERERNEREDRMNPPGASGHTGDAPAAEDASATSSSANVNAEPRDNPGAAPAQAIEI